MIEKIKEVLQQVDEFVIDSAKSNEDFRIKFLVKKGLVNELVEDFRNIDNNQKKEVGKTLNQLKEKARIKWEEAKEKYEGAAVKQDKKIDLSLPVNSMNFGGKHPISVVMQEISEIFKRIGFSTEEGPDIEDDYHNFSALNFAENHPARDMQDTFFVDDNFAIRTHTSSVQIRVMEKQKPPIRVICPGRVYRNEDVSARSNCFFHQIEGLYVD